MADYADLRNLFDSLDLNKNGTLTRGELITALRVKVLNGGADDVSSWGFKGLGEIADFFDQADANKDKVTTFDEFATVMEARQTT